MRNQVQSFPVDLHDIYEDARASMKTSRPRGWSTLWGLTAVAALVGAGLGWYLAIEQGVGPAGLGPVVAVADPALEIAMSGAAAGDTVEAAAGTRSAPIDTAAGWLRHDRLTASPVLPLAANAWPIILHRAGDGQFYADLALGGHIVNCRIDPGLASSTLRRSDLPDNVALDGTLLEATDAVLEHLRLPTIRLLVSDDPTAETVLGGDLLGRFFTIEEGVDRLRLAPRAG
jgi:hypothetical protein